MAIYESELTGFLKSLQKAQPDLERKQREARAIWWDTAPDEDEQSAYRAARVHRGSYEYYPVPARRSPQGEGGPA